MSYCKYVRKRKQYLKDGNWYDYSPQIYEKGEKVQCGLTTCTDSPTTEPITPPDPITYERWVTVSGEYMCEGWNKYYKEQKQTSADGINWTNTDDYRSGSLIQTNSTDCGYGETTWVEVPNEYICVPVDEPDVEWKLLPDVYMCDEITTHYYYIYVNIRDFTVVNEIDGGKLFIVDIPYLKVTNGEISFMTSSGGIGDGSIFYNYSTETLASSTPTYANIKINRTVNSGSAVTTRTISTSNIYSS